MASIPMKRGIYDIGFFYIVLLNGRARARGQLSVAQGMAHLHGGIAAFSVVGNAQNID